MLNAFESHFDEHFIALKNYVSPNSDLFEHMNEVRHRRKLLCEKIANL